MRILITGASGFVGPHLARELLNNGHEVLLTAPVKFDLRHSNQIHAAHICDLLDQKSLRTLVEKTRPEAVIHLAGLSHVHEGTKNREKMVELNVLATAKLCASLSQLNAKIAFLIVSSALMYPPSVNAETVVNEQTATKPDLPYGYSKLAAEYVAHSFASDNFRVYVARPFNHIGPGQSRDFVCPGLAHRIATTADGGTIPVGNMNAKRDFTDVRDMARAYRLIIEKQPTENLFVLGSGQATSIQTIFDTFIRISGKKITTKLDPDLLRSIDPPCFRSDYSLAKRSLDWEPQIPLEASLRDIYDTELSLALKL